MVFQNGGVASKQGRGMNLAQLSLSGPELGFRDAKRWEDLGKISVGRGQWKVQRLGGESVRCVRQVVQSTRLG